LKAKAKHDQEEAVRKAKEAAEAGKARVQDGVQQGKEKFNEVRLNLLHVCLRGVNVDVGPLLQATNAAQVKYDGYKADAQGRLKDARDSTENLYNEAKAKSQAQYEATKAEAQKKEEQAKAGWFSWLGWGKGKAEDVKKEGAEKVSEAAGEVKSRADKHT